TPAVAPLRRARSSPATATSAHPEILTPKIPLPTRHGSAAAQTPPRLRAAPAARNPRTTPSPSTYGELEACRIESAISPRLLTHSHPRCQPRIRGRFTAAKNSKLQRTSSIPITNFLALARSSEVDV